jgi:hypothetical protein
MNQGTPDPSVAIRKWVNGLELRMSDRCVSQNWDIRSSHERGQVGDPSGDSVMVWRDEVGFAGAEPAAADPHLLFAPTPGDVRTVWLHEHLVHDQYRGVIQPLCQIQCGLHGADVAHDEVGVVGSRTAQVGQSDRPCAGGEVLDL